MLAQNKTTPFLLGYRLYVVAFFLFLAAPLISAGAFAFNDSRCRPFNMQLHIAEGLLGLDAPRAWYNFHVPILYEPLCRAVAFALADPVGQVGAIEQNNGIRRRRDGFIGGHAGGHYGRTRHLHRVDVVINRLLGERGTYNEQGNEKAPEGTQTHRGVHRLVRQQE